VDYYSFVLHICSDVYFIDTVYSYKKLTAKQKSNVTVAYKMQISFAADFFAATLS
jgi:hypothetical protein